MASYAIRDSIEQKRTKQLDDDTEDAYEAVTTATDRKVSTLGQLQKMAKLFQKFDGAFERDTRRAANALKQLAGVPLTAENANWQFEQSLREAFRAAINEEAEGDMPADPDNPESPYPNGDYNENQAARAAFQKAIRIDADADDVKRVMKAIKEVGDE